MVDNRQDIYDKTADAEISLGTGRAQASGFHVPEAQAAYQQAMDDITAIMADLAVLSPDTSGALTLAPYPFEFPTHTGDAFSYQFQALGGTPPYRFQRLAGTIPLGLTLTADGLLSGTVEAFPPGFTFTLGLLDSATPNALVSGAVWIHILS